MYKNILKGLCYRLRKADEMIEALALSDVYGRIVHLFNTLEKDKDTDGTIRIKEPLTHKDIAAHVGASREMVSRILGDLVQGKYISIDNKKVALLMSFPDNW